MTETELQELIATAKVEQWKELALSDKMLKTFPMEITQLTNLEILILSSNQITVIPDEIAQLTNLEILILNNNEITVIPDEISQLTSLKRINLYSNQINVIPEAISQLTNLQELSLGENQINVIPKVIAQLTNLQGLYLGKNQITIIPDEIAQLTNLQKLYLSSNQINVIPEAISQLTNLQILDLNSNRITAIPDVIANLTSLQILYLSDNQIMVIPDAIANLTNLQRLPLFNNQIMVIPDAIARLNSLLFLNLDNNQITVIPDAIANLTSLQHLDLNNNQITVIPTAIHLLAELEELDLRYNPIGIPPEILAPGEYWKTPTAKPIIDYYFATRDPNKTQILYEAKLLLVGEGYAGKTSLANKVLDPDYKLKPPTKDTSTQGIDILQWQFSGRDGNTYKINIWDFGGQEIYHQTHQFFLTERSLYLLVADSRKEDTDHYWWLQVVQLYSKDSPVLLIQNEKDNRTCNLNYKDLRREFTNLRDTHSINLADNRGLAELQTKLQQELEKLLTKGIPFPNKWFAVRYALENDNRNYIDCAEYEATCRTHGITDRAEMFQLSDFLHKLGVCLHFQAKNSILRQRVILNPNWGTTAVYKILDNKRVKDNLGRFSDADLSDIWQADEYTEMHHELLELMKAFKVCYEIPRRKGEYIAPHLLSSDSPTYDLTDDKSAKTLRFQYKFMPKGILTRFIVEMHSDIENVSDPTSALVWKTGVVLQENNARAEIIEHYQQQDITIKIVGDRPSDLMTIISRKLREIHEYFQIQPEDYETKIPCNCDVCKSSSTPFEFTLDRLYKYLDRGKYSIECQESITDVNVRGLIDNVLSEDRSDKLRDRDSSSEISEKQRDQRIPDTNVYTTVVISNNNQQEQTMDDSKDNSQFTTNLQGATIGNFANQVNDHAQQKAIQHNYAAEQQSLAESAKEIQDLIEQLAKTYRTDTRAAKNSFADEIVKQIDANPAIADRFLSATKAGGVAAIEQLLNHPLASFVVAAIEDWKETKTSK